MPCYGPTEAHSVTLLPRIVVSITIAGAPPQLPQPAHPHSARVPSFHLTLSLYSLSLGSLPFHNVLVRSILSAHLLPSPSHARSPLGPLTPHSPFFRSGPSFDRSPLSSGPPHLVLSLTCPIPQFPTVDLRVESTILRGDFHASQLVKGLLGKQDRNFQPSNRHSGRGREVLTKRSAEYPCSKFFRNSFEKHSQTIDVRSST